MNGRVLAGTASIVILWLCAAADSAVASHAGDPMQGSTAVRPVRGDTIVTARATGTFDVTLTPESPEEPAEGISLGRMSIDKQFHGDLEGSSRGQMLTALTRVEGSAGYVAIERVSGTLAGRSGSFVLQHNGIMNRSAPQLTITVVPDSATDELEGLTGSMTIEIVDGRHRYEFDYSLPASP